MNTEQTRAAFEAWVAQFDTDSDEYQDMGADQYFIAGYQAALDSPEVQALREDAERYKTWRDSYFLAENNPINWGLVCAQTADEVDQALDAMEKQK